MFLSTPAASMLQCVGGRARQLARDTCGHACVGAHMRCGCVAWCPKVLNLWGRWMLGRMQGRKPVAELRLRKKGAIGRRRVNVAPPKERECTLPIVCLCTRCYGRVVRDCRRINPSILHLRAETGDCMGTWFPGNISMCALWKGSTEMVERTPSHTRVHTRSRLDERRRVEWARCRREASGW